MRRAFALVIAACLLIPPAVLFAESRTIARCGDGWLEEINGYPVLHLKGSPYEMGYQHGVLMRERVRVGWHALTNGKGVGAARLGGSNLRM